MRRMQIRVTEEQARALQEVAQGRGTSVAEIVREFVELGLESSARRDRLYARALAPVEGAGGCAGGFGGES